MAKYALGVNTDFTAKHYLVGGDFGPEGEPRFGAEGEPHSHDYRIEVVLEGDRLDEHGFLVDIVRVKAELGELVGRYRDSMLNDLPEFAGTSTGCEVFSRVVAEALSERLGLGRDIPAAREDLGERRSLGRNEARFIT